MVNRRGGFARVRTLHVDRNENGCPNFHCKLGPCMCDRVVRLNAPKNYVPLTPDHNRGDLGKLLDSPAFKNCPSAEEYCAIAEAYATGGYYKGRKVTGDVLQEMWRRIPRL